MGEAWLGGCGRGGDLGVAFLVVVVLFFVVVLDILTNFYYFGAKFD